MKQLFGLVLFFFSVTGFSEDWGKIEKIAEDLKGPGLVGEVHGATAPHQLFVFTYRNPENFTEHLEFPMVAANENVTKELGKIARHDRVKIRGTLIKNSAPVQHLRIEEISMVKKFEGALSKDPYQYEAQLPNEIVDRKEIHAKVHAVADEGKVLVLEYKDAVLPVFVANPELSKGLYRNDKVKVKINAKKVEGRPLHVVVDMKAEQPLTVTDRMTNWHGKIGSVTGPLVLFPKSPIIKFNIFAIQDIDENGTRREFTLINFDDPKIFEQIREKLQLAWDKNKETAKNGKNKLVNPNLIVKATGKFSITDPTQANPQILLESADNLEIVVK